MVGTAIYPPALTRQPWQGSTFSGRMMTPLMNTFLVCWFVIHASAVAWMIWEVARANRK